MRNNTRIFILASDAESLNQTMKDVVGEGRADVRVIQSVDFDDDNLLDDPVAINLIEAFNIARISALADHCNMIVMRSGVAIKNADVDKLCSDIEEESIMMATLLDTNNKNIEYTSAAESGFPVPKFKKGEIRSGIIDSWWIDGPVLAFSYEALRDVGAFDEAVQEHFFMVDYSVRARWLQMSVKLNHDVKVEYLNTKHFSSVFKDRESEIFMLGQQNFMRKHGGDVLRTLRG